MTPAPQSVSYVVIPGRETRVQESRTEIHTSRKLPLDISNAGLRHGRVGEWVAHGSKCVAPPLATYPGVLDNSQLNSQSNILTISAFGK